MPSPVPSLLAQSRRLDAGPNLVAQFGDILAQIKGGLAFGDHFGRREDRRIVEILLVHQLLRRGIRCAILDEFGDRRLDLRIHDEIHECMRILRTWRASRNGKAVLPHFSALGRNDIGDVGVLTHDLQDVAIVFLGEIDIARSKQVLAVVIGIDFHILLAGDEQLLDLLVHRRIG
jgi:hypothetical protein